MDPIALYATQPHYVDTLAPVAQALRQRAAGIEWWTSEPSVRTRLRLFDVHDSRRGRPRGGTVVVAGGMDARDVSGHGGLVAHLNHGAGQTYNGDGSHPVDSHGYTGGPDLDGVGLFCVNRDSEGDVWKARYPAAEVVTTGPPILDGAWRFPSTYSLVVFCFHWPCQLVAEAGTAFSDWAAEISVLAQMPEDERGYRMAVALHPRWHGRASLWAEANDFDVLDRRQVLQYASTLVVDNSSLGYEAAALGIPTIWLNASAWRKDVEHGLRFWSDVPGPMLDPGVDLAAEIDDRERKGPTTAERVHAEMVCDRVYGRRDRMASDRAAEAILRCATRR